MEGRQIHAPSFPTAFPNPSPYAITPWGLVVGVYEGGAPEGNGFAYSTIQQKAYDLNIRHQPTVPTAINGAGQVTGYVDFVIGGYTTLIPFLYRYGEYTLLPFTTGRASIGTALNKAGTVVGYNDYYYRDRDFSKQTAFIYDAGKYTTFKIGDAATTLIRPQSISDNGVIGGYNLYNLTTDRPRGQGFIYENGNVRTIDIPGAVTTSIKAVNSHGEAIGIYNKIYNDFGSSFRLSGGVVRYLGFPGSSFTAVQALNEAGSIVGSYATSSDPYGASHAFIAVCDPPGSRCGD